MNDQHRYVISIPLNVRDLNAIDEKIPWEDVEFEDFEITREDYDNLFRLFCEFDKQFGIFVDEYEEEVISASDISAAIVMAERYARKASSKIKVSTEKFLVALRRAKKLGRQLAFFF